ncbi:hypothetical protein CAL13_08740 [Bordetella genomosp. 9]|uniref:Uncharacterized protein n=2 Tax=Bordetella genomosp. 9 TaxID=1416803 RepID=A0A1W6YYZ4_9BORD|nr:hypothetical protein CAL13_08740 [Bordetella genomosp. 9]
MGPVVFCLFCDSVRREIGGTMSLVGVYQDQVIAEGFPLRLPRLTAFVSIHDSDGKFADGVQFEIFRTDNEDVIADVYSAPIDPESIDSPLNGRDTPPRGVAVLEMQNLEFQEPMTLRMRLKFSDGTHCLSPTVLRIRQRPSERANTAE